MEGGGARRRRLRVYWLLKGAHQQQDEANTRVLWRSPAQRQDFHLPWWFLSVCYLCASNIWAEIKRWDLHCPPFPTAPQAGVTPRSTQNAAEMRKKMGANKRSMQYRGINRVFCAVSFGRYRGLNPLSQHTTAIFGRFLIEKIPQGYFILSVSFSAFSPSPHCAGKKQLEEFQLLPTI